MEGELVLLDAYLAILCLLSKLRAESSRCSNCKIVFLHQLYCLVKNRTTLTEELSRLRDANMIKVFTGRLSSDCFAIMLTADYCAMLTEPSCGDHVTAAAFSKFSRWINCNKGKGGYSVLKSTLLGFGGECPASKRATGAAPSSSSASSSDWNALTTDEVRTLLRAGFLFPRKDVASMGTLSVPRECLLLSGSGGDGDGDGGAGTGSSGSHRGGASGGFGVDELYWIAHPKVGMVHCVALWLSDASMRFPLL